MVLVLPVPVPFLGIMWNSLSPHLLRGLGASDGNLQATIDDLFADKATLWVVKRGEKDLLGVFLTAIVDDDGKRALDVYALSGEDLLSWGKEISAEMRRYAKSKDCHRVIFVGRRGLLRAYEGAEIVGEIKPGIYQFSGAV
ncbi:hypothetical protein [Filomicrobium sp.]|uniref:hypothetical protein n=1 Tax=Filomicrobium sp. TaxID=2024831 RepID=UPI00258EC80B|nr:hypothetical protein [Filomicrobium sp.]MCV0371717.1 hypothetical protein [Filomicrobium sp.]